MKKKPGTSKKVHVFSIRQKNDAGAWRRGRKTASFGRSNNKILLSVLKFLLSLLLIALLVPAAIWLLGEDANFYFAWLGISVALGVAVLPLSLRLCKRYPAIAMPLAMPLGFALVTFTAWTLAHLHLVPLQQLFIALIALVWALIAYLWPGNFRNTFIALKKPNAFPALFATIAMFGAALLAMVYVRSLNPAARGLEKFMDYGFMMSVWRSDYLPAADMWFAGSGINYYYYGQFAYTTLAKLGGIQPRYAFNLSLGSSLAYMFTLAFSFAYILLKRSAVKARLQTVATSVLCVIGSLLTALFACFAGNSHSFFIGASAPGRFLPERLSPYLNPAGQYDQWFFYPNSTRYIGYNPPTGDKTIHEFPYYSFLVADLHAHLVNTVFVLLLLVCLLLLSESVPLLRLGRKLRSKSCYHNLELGGLAVYTDRDGRYLSGRGQLLGQLLKSFFTSPQLLTVSLLLAISMMGNYWDFAIYSLVLGFFIWYTLKRGLGSYNHWGALPLGLMQLALFAAAYIFISNSELQLTAFALSVAVSLLIYLILPALWTAAGALFGMCFTLTHALAYLFNHNFTAMAKSVHPVMYSTPFYQLAVLYGPQLLLIVLFVFSLLLKSRRIKYKSVVRAKAEAEYSAANLAEQNDTGADYAKKLAYEKGRQLLSDAYKRKVDKRVKSSARLLRYATRRSFLRKWDSSDVAILLLMLCALIFIALPEFVYIKDIYGDSYARANTMFKFTYQAMLILGICMVPAVFKIALEARRRVLDMRIAKEERKAQAETAAAAFDKTAGIALTEAPQNTERKNSSAYRAFSPAYFIILCVLCIALLIPPSFYPLIATAQAIPTLSRSKAKGIDAAGWMFEPDSLLLGQESYGDALYDIGSAINRLNADNSAPLTILEASSDSYTDYCIFSAYTGHASVLGWQTHEHLWRSAPGIDSYTTLIAPRNKDIRTIYESESAQERKALLEKYNIKLIVISDLERIQYHNIKEADLAALGKTVFSQDSVKIIELS